MAKAKKTISKKSSTTYLEKLEDEIKSNNSPFSLILGALIVIVVGVLVFNFFNQRNQDLGPASQTDQAGDVSPDKLPGKYTVKEGDTLFTIAEHYYKDGYKFEEVAKANKLEDVNNLMIGQVLEIPKVEAVAEAPEAKASVAPAVSEDAATQGTGGGDTTVWGPKITGDTYTVVEGDWLSTISARAYGDVMAYNKIAVANNIPNPDLIEPGQVLKLPR